jgi:hypothetical protein
MNIPQMIRTSSLSMRIGPLRAVGAVRHRPEAQNAWPMEKWKRPEASFSWGSSFRP